MAETVIEHVYRLKGGEQIAVEYENPMLERREPIVVFCTDGITRMKIGDGVHKYNELDWVKVSDDNSSEREIEIFTTHFEFPIPGDPNVIYRAVNEATLYQWNNTKYKYEPLVNADVDIDIDISDIEMINGGRASDLLRVL